MERASLNYDSFIKSLKEPKVHKIDSFDGEVHLDTDEVMYLLGTSGSRGKKYYLHSISSIERGVQSFLEKHPLSLEDRWWVSLSTKHVAGFAILARSYFGNLKTPYEAPFGLNTVSALNTVGTLNTSGALNTVGTLNTSGALNTSGTLNTSDTFDTRVMETEGITVLSLVPTQVFDLVVQKKQAPRTIKYVFVGGASLSHLLFKEAKRLGWPLVPCFGSIETFAQFASSDDNKTYEVYKGWSVQSNTHGELQVHGPSLFSYQVFEGEDKRVKPREEGWFNLKDQVSIKDQISVKDQVSIKDQISDQVKSL